MHTYRDFDETVNPTAALFVAAPDLLDACKMVILTAESGHETGSTESECVAGNWDVLRMVLRAAIARAEGVQLDQRPGP